MAQFVLNMILWTLAIYGLIEIVKTIYYICSYTNLKPDGIYLILAVKNQEEKIEGFVRNFLFRVIYGKEEHLKDIILTDLDSHDGTKEIIEKLGNEYDYIKVTNWRECKEIIDTIEDSHIEK